MPLTLSAKSSPIEYLRDRRLLREFVRGARVDVIHAHLSHDHGLMALAGRSSAVVRVRTFHADRSLVRRFGQAWLTRRAEGWILRAEAHRQLLLARFGVPPERTCVIPGALDATPLLEERAEARQRLRKAWGVPADAPLIGHVALIADRGQEELVEAIRLIGDPAPYVIFIGRGEGEAALDAHIRDAGVASRVRRAGYLQGEALLDGYAALDAAFLAQPGNDASARAALEAMAACLPVVGVRTGALAELIDDAVGYPIETRTPDQIAGGIRAWLRDSDHGAARGAAGRERVTQTRSFAREAERTLAFYESLENGRP
jgi:glycosyltransferase involved in cell wall biosynthesis